MISSQPISLLRRLLPLFLLLGLLTSRALPGTGAPPQPRLVAGAVCEKGEKQRDEVSAETGGIAFVARPIPLSEWEERLERRVAGMGPALRRHDGSPGPFQVFLLSIRNRSNETLRFQPGNIVRVLGDTQQDHILDYTDLYRHLVEEGKDADSLDRIRDTFFDSGLVLDRAGSVERLLFFRALPPKGRKKQLVLLISSFQVGTETLQAGFTWHFEKEKK
jgi:hypothetical protein